MAVSPVGALFECSPSVTSSYDLIRFFDRIGGGCETLARRQVDALPREPEDPAAAARAARLAAARAGSRFAPREKLQKEEESKHGLFGAFL